MLPAKTYTIVVPASGTYNLPVQGSFFKVLTATGLVQVAGDTFGTLGNILPGQGLRDTNFNGLQFQDKTGAINTLTVLVAGQTFIDDRVTGSVEVIDVGVNRTLSGQGYSVAGSQLAVAGQYSYLSLFNVSTTKRVRIDRLIGDISLAGGITGAFCGLPAGTAVINVGASKLIGGGLSAAIQLRGLASATDYLAGFVPQLYAPSQAAHSMIDISFKYPIVLTPSNGLIMRTSVVNCDFTAWLEMVEETA